MDSSPGGRTSDLGFDELLLSARQGSNEALGRVLESCRRVLLRAAREQVPPDIRSKGAASDVVQETFLEAQRDFQQFAGSTREQLIAWLFRILQHNSANLVSAYRYCRKREIAREVSLDDTRVNHNLEQTLLATEPSPTRTAIAHEEAGILHLAMERLSEQAQRALHLRFVERLSFEEIGSQLGCSPEAARKFLSRAVKQLSGRCKAKEGNTDV
jgi:RNA polymerase sigma-70 factor, ECF subfamily